MASPSTVTARHTAYDVYINHRGPDAKMTFASSLYHRLVSQGLSVFLDLEELQMGEIIEPQITEAIRTASVSVAIFSPRYADSVWCLNELVLMLESKAPIIPVFYHVNPSELWGRQGKDGIYAESLRNHAKNSSYDSAIIENWESALSDVTKISGFDLEACNGDEGKLLDRLVECVLNRVKRPKIVKLTQFESLLHQEHSRKPAILGIVGLGGSGKTTLAKEFFNRNKSDYHRSCFLSDVRDYAAKGSLISLQRKLIKNLTGLDKPVNSIDEGKEMLIKPLKSFSVLVILDDVDSVNQKDALLPVRTHDLRTGSLILITTRDIDLLQKPEVEISAIYRQTGLSEKHSLNLFCSHAFGGANPSSGFESLVPIFSESCNRLPLYLKVFGALLNGTHLEYWEDKLKSLQNFQNFGSLQQALKISYEALDEKEKRIFLDIACFFIGENMDMAIRIWDGFGWEGRRWFQSLQNKCLVEVDSWNVIHMHDLLRDLGREVAAASSTRRLWDWTENVSDNLVQQSSVITVQGIRTVLSEYNDDDVFSAIGTMSLQLPDTDTENSDTENSHCLAVEGRRRFKDSVDFAPPPSDVVVPNYIPDVVGGRLHRGTTTSYLDRISRRVKFSNLIWLCWRECPYTSLPSWIPAMNLKVLQVSGSTLEALWHDKAEAPLLLEELWANGCPQLQSLRGLAHCRELRKLIVSKCCQLEELPSMETFASLEELLVEECVTLKSITGLAQCTKLRHLNVSGCFQLQKLPSMEAVEYLEKFYASKCVKVKSIGELVQCTKLRHLNVSGCSDLENLPSMKTLVSLEELRVNECVKLKNIPELLHCTKLKHLDVSGCFELKVLPSMEALVSLEELWANRCVKLESITGLENATKLRQLSVSDCSELKELPTMETLICLEELWADNCVKLKSIRGLEQATKLRLLNVSDCSELKELPVMGNLKSLKILRATGCVRLKSITGLEQCRKLRMLSVSRCCDLEELPGMETLVSLEEFYACECVKLKSIQELELLTKLRYFSVSNCPELKELPSMETLVSLEMIGVTGCVKLTSIQGLAQCTELRNLSVSGCYELEELPSIETLISLEALRAEECVKLTRITGLERCTKLRHLDISGCSELREFPGMETLVSLEEFYAAGCKKLQIIRGLEYCTKLRRLSVSGCSELKELPTMEMLVSLEVLLADNCVKLQRIDGLAQCTDLRTLIVDGCCELKELGSMETLVSLEELRVNNCGKLKRIRGLGQCTMLRHLDVRQCSELIELEGVEHCTLLDLSTFPKLLLGDGVVDRLRRQLHQLRRQLHGGTQSRSSRRSSGPAA